MFYIYIYMFVRTTMLNPLHAKYAYMPMGVVKKKNKKKEKNRRSIAGIEPVTTGLVD